MSIEIQSNVILSSEQETFEKLFPGDRISKRERVELTLRHQPVDRVVLLEQLSYNPRVITLYTGKDFKGFEYTIEDICAVIRKTMDVCFPPKSPIGTERVTDADGFVMQNDNWTTWHVSRPFNDVEGSRRWLEKKTDKMRNAKFDAERARDEYRRYMLSLQRMLGDTVIINFSYTGMCEVFDSMGLEMFTYFYADYPEVMSSFMEVSVENELRRIHAVADRELSPVIFILEDFSSKQGPIFGPAFLNVQHYPYIRKLVDAWHSHGISVIYHSDGNYKKVIPDLMRCGIDGFYCLEPNCGMDIVELKKTWPEMVWAGGVDGVDLMERGTPDQVRRDVHRHVVETGALKTGGMFIASSSEINPPIKPENFKAMVDAVGEMYNPDFHRQ